MEKIREKALKGMIIFKNKVAERIKNSVNNNRGEGVITMLIFTALLIFAVLALDSTIRDIFSSAASKFSTWIGNELDTLFS